MTPAVSLTVFVLIGFVAGVAGKGSNWGNMTSIVMGILGAWVGGNFLRWIGVTNSTWFSRYGFSDYEVIVSLIMAGVGAMLFLHLTRLGKEH